MKKRRFFFHYNKPASVAQGRNVLTVHWRGACHLVHHIQCYVPIETKARKSQPRCVMQGIALRVVFDTTLDGQDRATIL